MRKLLFAFLSLCYFSSRGQNVISSVNSGAYSGADFIYSVGEIYVNPVGDPDEANSGLMGILYQIEFNSTGINEVLYSDDLRVYPNPTCSSIFFEIKTESKIDHVYIFNSSGLLIYSTKLIDKKIDLSNLSSGTYFIKTNIEDISALKIIKQ